jgi:2-haloacid dehalogenase
MNPDALVFDLYGTLLDIGSVEQACATATDSPASFLALWRQKQLEYAWHRSLMGRYEDFWTVTGDALEFTAERTGVALDEVTRARLMKAWVTVRAYPETLAALGRFGTRRLAVLSNGTAHMIQTALQESGLDELIDHVISVDEARIYKPSPAVYALAEKHLGMARTRMLFVSSNCWDAAGAKAFGLPTAWVNRSGAPIDRLGCTPDLVAADLAALADMIET